MDYTSKVISLETALSLVKSGDTVVTGLGAAEAGSFMENLHLIANRVKNVRIVNCNPTHAGEFYKSDYVDSFSVDGWFFAPAMNFCVEVDFDFLNHSGTSEEAKQEASENSDS